MGKVSDVLIENEELRDWIVDLQTEVVARDKRIEHLSEENARLSGIIRETDVMLEGKTYAELWQEMVLANMMLLEEVKILRKAVGDIDMITAVATQEIDLIEVP